MSAATAAIPIIYRGEGLQVAMGPQKGSTTLYPGTLCMYDSSGYVTTAADTASCTIAGVVVGDTNGTWGANAVNGGSDGASKVMIAWGAVFLFAQSGLTIAGVIAEVTDNQTVSNTSTNHVKVGELIQIETFAGLTSAAWLAIRKAKVA